MKMKKIIISGLAVLFAGSIFAQRASTNFDMYSTTIEISQKALSFGLSEAQFEAIKNEAYANPNFLQGTIYQGEEAIKTNVLMRYNTYADEIEIKKNATAESFSALIKAPDIFVKILNNIYVFVPYEGSNEKGGYFNVLSDGKTYDLYKKTKSEYRAPEKAKTSYQHDTPATFKKEITYYLVLDGTFLQMPNSKSKILKMMDSKKGEMKNYIKENDIDLDKEVDLIKTISYFDSLL